MNVAPAARWLGLASSSGRWALETEMFGDQPRTFITKDPPSAASLRALERIRRFVLDRGMVALIFALTENSANRCSHLQHHKP
jgi:hypothetical protein